MAEPTLPPILYWSRARAEHPDACETAPGVVIDTASKHGLVLGSADDSWQVLSGLPGDAVRLVAEPPADQRLNAALTLIDNLMDRQAAGVSECGWTAGVRWNAAEWVDMVERRNRIALAAPSGPSGPTDPAGLLRLAASGRREYAASGGPHTSLLKQEAPTFEQAARIVSGDRRSLQGALPSWRWSEIPDHEPAPPAAGRSLPDGEDDAEVWIPPSDDCMDSGHAPCPHCGSSTFHVRAGRCGSCGRRPEPPTSRMAEPRPDAVATAARAAAELWGRQSGVRPLDQEQFTRAMLDLLVAIQDSEDHATSEPAARDGDADELLLVRDDDRQGGRVTIGHSRLPVAMIAGLLARGALPKRIRSMYPGVTDEQLRALGALRRELAADPADPDRPDVEREYRDALYRLIALPHPDAIPAAWWERPAPGAAQKVLRLTDVVDVLCRHLGANSVGAPSETATVEPVRPDRRDVALERLQAAGDVLAERAMRVVGMLGDRDDSSPLGRLADGARSWRAAMEAAADGVDLLAAPDDDPMPVELAVSVLSAARLTDRETHALRSLAAVLDGVRPGAPEPNRTTWRQGGKVPHHLYRQRGPEPDRRPYPDGDDPIGIMLSPDDAALAVRAVNALAEGQAAEATTGTSEMRTIWAALGLPPERWWGVQDVLARIRDLEARARDVELGLDGVGLIAAERRRQVDVEGWTAEHDAGHSDDALILAAACYLLPFWRRRDGDRAVPLGWPWAPEYWKPSPDDRVRELVKAGALVAAEIDRRRAAAEREGDRG